MSNNIEKAQALREFADLVESGRIPVSEGHDHALSIHFGYSSAEDVRKAADVFLADGRIIEKTGNPNEPIVKAVYSSSEYWPALEVLLYDWSDSGE